MTEEGKRDFGSEYEVNSRRAHFFGYVLLLGLVLELVNALIWYRGLETLAEMAAVLLIVGGVWGEIFFAHKARIASDNQLATYEARTAEANQKAQEATLELAKYRAPRVLTQEQMYRIAEKLKGYRGIQFAGATSGRDPEFLTFLQFIENSLMLANWQQIPSSSSTGVMRIGKADIGTDVSVSNVLITFPMDAMGKVMESAAVALADALKAEGFAAKAGLDARNSGAINVMVGPKT
jgi:hypothetical protein